MNRLAMFIGALSLVGIGIAIGTFSPGRRDGRLPEIRAGSALPTISQAFVDVAEKAKPSVVNVSVWSDGSGNAWREYFGYEAPNQPDATGSGAIIEADGLILTNNHVVSRARKIVVRLADGREFPATLVGTDPITEVALLRIRATGLVPFPIGDSDAVRVGQWVIAIGSPFGQESTVTAGIISAVGRRPRITYFEDYLQTDAAINPGNSGGPLLDLDGNLIGINTAILSRTGGYQGIGFAIPSRLAREIAGRFLTAGGAWHGFLGVEVVENSPDLAKQFDLGTEKGIVITGVQRGFAADRAGIAPGDVAQSLDGEDLAGPKDLRRRIDRIKPGETATLGIVRKGEARTVRVTIGDYARYLEETR